MFPEFSQRAFSRTVNAGYASASASVSSQWVVTVWSVRIPAFARRKAPVQGKPVDGFCVCLRAFGHSAGHDEKVALHDVVKDSVGDEFQTASGGDHFVASC